MENWTSISKRLHRSRKESQYITLNTSITNTKTRDIKWKLISHIITASVNRFKKQEVLQIWETVFKQDILKVYYVFNGSDHKTALSIKNFLKQNWHLKLKFSSSLPIYQQTSHFAKLKNVIERITTNTAATKRFLL